MDASMRAKRNMLEEYSEEIADEGRGEDSVIAHLTPGEVVIPKEFMENEEVAAMLQEVFAAYQANINQYTVGHKENSINPKTGNPEFLRIRIRAPKIVKQALGTIVGAGVGYFTGGPAGALKGAQVGAGVDVARAGYSAAETAQKESQAARAEAAQQAAEATRVMEEQVAAQQRQADLAAARLEEQKAQYAKQQEQYAAERAKLDADVKAKAAELEAERRKIAERESAAMKARRRGGTRSLLSQARLSPELGLTSTTDQYNRMM